MGKTRFAPHLRRFAHVPRVTCVYVAEMQTPSGPWLKVGMGSNAMGRMISLRAEVKRVHGATLGRFAIYRAPNFKAAYEAETRAVKALWRIAPPVEGHREFFSGLTFEIVCEIASAALGDCPCAFIGEEVTEAPKGGDVYVNHSKIFDDHEPVMQPVIPPIFSIEAL